MKRGEDGERNEVVERERERRGRWLSRRSRERKHLSESILVLVRWFRSSSTSGSTGDRGEKLLGS